MYPTPTPQEIEWLQEAARDRMLNEWAAEKHPELLSLPESEQIRLKTAIVREIQEHQWNWNANNIEAGFCVDALNRNAEPIEATGSKPTEDENFLRTAPLDQVRAHFERLDAGKSKSSYVQRYHGRG